MYFMSVNKFKSAVDPTKIKEVVPSHIQWIKKLITEGKIVQAGKWGDSGGMAILKAENITEAEKTLNEDPLIQSGLVAFELARFYPDVNIE